MFIERGMDKEDAWCVCVCVCVCDTHTHNGILSSVQFSCSVVSNSLQPHELQHARPPCPSPTPGVHSDSRPSSQWCHPTISSSVIPFSSCPQSLLLSHKKKHNNTICNNIDASRGYHTKWSQSEREIQIPYDITYMWNLKCGTNL